MSKKSIDLILSEHFAREMKESAKEIRESSKLDSVAFPIIYETIQDTQTLRRNLKRLGDFKSSVRDVYGSEHGTEWAIPDDGFPLQKHLSFSLSTGLDSRDRGKNRIGYFNLAYFKTNDWQRDYNQRKQFNFRCYISKKSHAYLLCNGMVDHKYLVSSPFHLPSINAPDLFDGEPFTQIFDAFDSFNIFESGDEPLILDDFFPWPCSNRCWNHDYSHVIHYINERIQNNLPENSEYKRWSKLKRSEKEIVTNRIINQIRENLGISSRP